MIGLRVTDDVYNRLSACQAAACTVCRQMSGEGEISEISEGKLGSSALETQLPESLKQLGYPKESENGTKRYGFDSHSRRF